MQSPTVPNNQLIPPDEDKVLSLTVLARRWGCTLQTAKKAGQAPTPPVNLLHRPIERTARRNALGRSAGRASGEPNIKREGGNGAVTILAQEIKA